MSIHRHHYLGYKTLPGAQLRYFVTSGEQSLPCWVLVPAPGRPRCGITTLHRVVNNARFLILPWVRSKNLVSMTLSMAARRLPADWESRYHYRPVLLETFVEKDRFVGTSYKAANWVHVGQTKGRGKLAPASKQSVPIKRYVAASAHAGLQVDANSITLRMGRPNIYQGYSLTH